MCEGKCWGGLLGFSRGDCNFQNGNQKAPLDHFCDRHLPAGSWLCNPSKWLRGKWEGMGDQIDGQKWKIVLDASDLRNVLINYPDLGCGGTWHLMRKSQDAPRLKEHITFGLDICNQDCEMILERLEDGSIKVTYYLLSYSNDPTATGVIRKVK
jgi:hypothetical protein